jgi:hypothetical protein
VSKAELAWLHAQGDRGDKRARLKAQVSRGSGRAKHRV